MEQQQECQLEPRRFFSESTMSEVSEPEEPMELTDGEPAEQAAAAMA